VPSSVLHADCVPVLVEVGEDYRIDMDDFRAKLPGADAVLISHMRGHTSDMDAIMALADAAGIPVIEDAAHSLGTTWGGRNIGTIGRIGCFSFQSYKLVNAGEGGILVTDDADLIARAVIMSGAYEHNWKKHPVLQDAFARWQNRLPLYNTRLNNLSAAVIRPQIAELPRRVRDGRRNHDHVAAQLARASPWIRSRQARPRGARARLDPVQPPAHDRRRGPRLRRRRGRRGVPGADLRLSEDNARAFWNWQFLGDIPDLPKTRAMLMRACDARLPARLTPADCDAIAEAILDSMAEVMGSEDTKAVA
jgi:dTDP-4-amino-4,6-dideoxygalactose transaminase